MPHVLDLGPYRNLRFTDFLQDWGILCDRSLTKLGFSWILIFMLWLAVSGLVKVCDHDDFRGED